MYSLLLFKETLLVDDVPAWWIKFMERYPEGTFDTVENANKVLEPYGVTFRTTKPFNESWGDRYLDFPTEADAIMFMLKV